MIIHYWYAIFILFIYIYIYHISLSVCRGILGPSLWIVLSIQTAYGISSNERVGREDAQRILCLHVQCRWPLEQGYYYCYYYYLLLISPDTYWFTESYGMSCNSFLNLRLLSYLDGYPRWKTYRMPWYGGLPPMLGQLY